MYSCTKCRNSGLYSYPNTATYRDGPGVISGRAIRKDVCDVCWGSGDAEVPGVDLLKYPNMHYTSLLSITNRMTPDRKSAIKATKEKKNAAQKS